MASAWGKTNRHGDARLRGLFFLLRRLNWILRRYGVQVCMYGSIVSVLLFSLSVFLSSDAARSLARIEHEPSPNGIGIRWWVVVVPKSKRTYIHAPSRRVAIVAEKQHLNSATCVVRFSVSQSVPCLSCPCCFHSHLLGLSPLLNVIDDVEVGLSCVLLSCQKD
ncbi:hypothetical protein IWZ03DRAFT_135228 [Phyllosticta citriasiana]|uniref:Uncharacterized protein n=1 Tax=Phyllosticta citriasiana TaxID=595635 RepID=A0ABR1KSB2_9PEZI